MFTQNELYIIGERICKARKSQNINQEKLAQKSGVSKSTISRIENGKSVKKEQLVNVSNALGINPIDVFGIDNVSDNIDDFINFFRKIMYSYDDAIETDGIINPTKLICYNKDTLVLYMSDKLINLFKDIAKAFADTKDIKDEKWRKLAYAERLTESKEKYKKHISLGVKPYYLISEEKLAQTIQKAVNDQKYFNKLMKSLSYEEN